MKERFAGTKSEQYQRYLREVKPLPALQFLIWPRFAYFFSIR